MRHSLSFDSRDRVAPLLGASALALSVALSLTAPCSAQNSFRGDITTTTYNLYVGAPIEIVLAAPTFPAVMQAVDYVWATVQATSFPDRAEVIADEIAAAQPELVALQEVALWRVQSPGDILLGGTTPATEVRYDFLQILLDEFAERGAHYEVIVSLDQLDAELPNTSGDDIRLTDRDVILARVDLPRWHFNVVNTNSGHYSTLLQLPVGGQGGPVVTVHRGWVGADVLFRGARVRFLNTHLEDAYAPIQEAQAFEFLSGPAAVGGRVIAVGDFNSDALTGSTMTYQMLLGAGFSDVWTLANPGQPGATWGQAPDLLNPTSTLSQRLDLVMIRGQVEAREAYLIGDEPGNRTATVPPLWPSDHAGVVAGLRVSNQWWQLWQ